MAHKAKESPGQPILEFLKTLKNKIRINSKNRNLRSKFYAEEEAEEDYETTLQRLLENSYRKYKKLRSYTNYNEEKAGIKLDSGSSFALFVLRKKHFRDVIPDIELMKYKKVCCEMISKLNSCHEAQFGLAKLLAHEGHYEQAEDHLNIALSEEKNSTMYDTWLGVLRSLSANSKHKAKEAQKFCESK